MTLEPLSRAGGFFASFRTGCSRLLGILLLVDIGSNNCAGWPIAPVGIAEALRLAALNLPSGHLPPFLRWW